MKIAGINYKVTLFDRETDESNDGNVWLRKAKMRVVRGDVQYMQQTLWHEILHAILAVNGDRELAQDEAFVSRTSSAIHQVLQDNPDLYAEIREKESDRHR